jgi:hypothetical protein
MTFIDKIFFLISKKDFFVNFDKEGAPSITYRSGETYCFPSYRPSHHRIEIGANNICRSSDILDIYHGKIVASEIELPISWEQIVKDLTDWCNKYKIEVVDTGIDWHFYKPEDTNPNE